MNYIIETERLKLRELTLDDTDKLSLVLSDPQSMRFYPHPFSREEVENWIKWNIDNYKKYGFGLWAVLEKEIKLNEIFRNRDELNLVYAAAMTFCFGYVSK